MATGKVDALEHVVAGCVLVKLPIRRHRAPVYGVRFASNGFAGGRIFWAGGGSGTIKSANLSGGGGGTLSTAPVVPARPSGVAAVPGGTKI
ncbi:MAG TPA: hypothetical protein VM285_12500 [Polyangia bacterium]|nr:hypothetical protein [Polyangia bacterium]